MDVADHSLPSCLKRAANASQTWRKPKHANRRAHFTAIDELCLYDIYEAPTACNHAFRRDSDLYIDSPRRANYISNHERIIKSRYDKGHAVKHAYIESLVRSERVVGWLKQTGNGCFVACPEQAVFINSSIRLVCLDREAAAEYRIKIKTPTDRKTRPASLTASEKRTASLSV